MERSKKYELTYSSVKMKLSWKMIGHPSLVTCKIDIHGSLLNIFAHRIIEEKKGDGDKRQSKQISMFLATLRVIIYRIQTGYKRNEIFVQFQ